MLIQDFLQVPRAFADIRAALLVDPHGLIDANVAAAYEEGERLCLRLRPLEKHPRFGKTVIVDLGVPYQRADGMILPVHWWAKGVTHLFPRLDADLEVMPIGDDTTQLTFSGRYDPPLGGLGRGLDKMLLHRLAEGSVRSFLNRMGKSLEAWDVSQRVPGSESAASHHGHQQTGAHSAIR